jgi:1-acyl-sn-glycerol-3-phosphate acyltransferase
VIPARKSPLFNAWFSRHVEGRLAETFGHVRVAGLENARGASARGPTLIVSNHTSWWDPLVTIYLSSRVLRTDGYALMDAKNLARVPFFARVGGFGVDLGDAADGARAIRYGASLLDRPGRLVWVFPQGRERPAGARPLAFVGGGAALARIAKSATCLPVALRYDFGAAERADLSIAIGAPLPYERDVGRGVVAQEHAVEAELARIDRALTSGSWEGFDVVLWEKRGVRWVLNVLAERALAWLSRPRGRVPRLR